MEPERWVEEYGDALYRYALGRIRNPAVAEDLVQETFLAALKGQDGFSGKSAVQTWLIGILRHKMLDRIRKESRMQGSEDMEQTLAAVEDERFDASGRWRTGPPDWETDPHAVLERKEFRSVLESCIGKMPPPWQRVFVLREMEDLEADFICKQLEISSSNLWVILHRARTRLRDCLSVHWFERKEVGA